MSFWLLLSVLIGFLGHDTKIGFVGHFLLSVVLSPIVGLVALYFFKYSKKADAKEENYEEAKPAAA